jgi:hypothetical protein
VHAERQKDEMRLKPSAKLNLADGFFIVSGLPGIKKLGIQCIWGVGVAYYLKP